MKTILTYGTFDLFHIGHLRLLKILKEMSENGRVIVGVSSDNFNINKGKNSLIPFEQRVEIIGAIDCVDIVLEEDSWEQKQEDIEKYNVDVFAIGDDWAGKFDYLCSLCEVVYLPRTHGVSTTELKEALDVIISLDSDDFAKTHGVLKLLSKDLS